MPTATSSPSRHRHHLTEDTPCGAAPPWGLGGRGGAGAARSGGGGGRARGERREARGEGAAGVAERWGGGGAQHGRCGRSGRSEFGAGGGGARRLYGRCTRQRLSRVGHGHCGLAHRAHARATAATSPPHHTTARPHDRTPPRFTPLNPQALLSVHARPPRFTRGRFRRRQETTGAGRRRVGDCATPRPGARETTRAPPEKRRRRDDTPSPRASPARSHGNTARATPHRVARSASSSRGAGEGGDARRSGFARVGRGG